MTKHDPNDDLSHVDVDPPSPYASIMLIRHLRDLANCKFQPRPYLVVVCPPFSAQSDASCSPRARTWLRRPVLLAALAGAAAVLTWAETEAAPILSGPQRDHVVFSPPSIPPQARPHIPVLPDWYFDAHFSLGHTFRGVMATSH
ncbi:hypothetical protein FIBSPDRAFT_1004557 [Athelia psychrophila]|uniref:Uncharacterized protein n=1 Tax=Athelia psychrophila TaxID=1759441 RepID=A0A167W177_9AGAM|nr:hypothetical protein FIBSPDRAFT_1004557 [Fibularhizoctonia sp. CBS 109695]